MLEELAGEELFPAAPEYMSVDEVAWQRWHKYVTTVFYSEACKVVWNHDCRDKSPASFTCLSQENAAKIEAAACDGASGCIPYIRQHAWNALMALDHFHGKLYPNDAVDMVWKGGFRKAKEDNGSDLSTAVRGSSCCRASLQKKQRNVLEKLAGLSDVVYRAMPPKEQSLAIYLANPAKQLRPVSGRGLLPPSCQASQH